MSLRRRLGRRLKRVHPAVIAVSERQMHRALLWRTGGESKRYSSRAGELHYYDIPGRGPLGTVVLLHGAAQGALHYASVILPLQRRFSRIIAPDAPAHGFSPTPHTVSSELLTDSLTELLDDLIGDGQAVVFGTSLGGGMAIHYGLRSPERVSQLCLLSPAGAPLSTTERQDLMRTFEMPRHRDSREFMRDVVHRPSMFGPVIAVETRRRFRSRPMRQLFESFATGADEFTAPDLASLKAPVRLVWGRRERVLPASNLSFFRKHLPTPGRTIVEPPHFAHAAFLEYPEEVSDHIAHCGRAAVTPPAAERVVLSRIS